MRLRLRLRSLSTHAQVRQPPVRASEVRMDSIIDVLFATTDPVTATLLVLLVYYTRQIKTELRREIRHVRGRVERLENSHIPESRPMDYPYDPRDADTDHDIDDPEQGGITDD